MLKEEKKAKVFRFLDRHDRISPKLRARMIDWFVEIVCTFNCHPNTFYMAVKILDMYFAKANSILSTKDLHLLGVTSIYIASKIEDMVPFTLKSVFNKIGHQSLPKEMIK